MKNDMIDAERKVDELLNANHLLGYAYCDKELPVIHIEMSGDWKHDHLALKNLMVENGYMYVGEKVTSDSESNWYEAVHSFIIPA